MATATGSRAIRFAGTPMDKLAAVILAGGKSSRMGQDKASLQWRGGRLVDYVTLVLNQAGISQVFVSGKIEGYDCIPDAITGHHGPVMGMCSSILKLGERYNHLLFVPVDMPLLSPEAIHQLIQHPLARFEGNPIPCVFPVTQMLQQYAAATIALPCSVRQFLSPLQPLVLEVDEQTARALRNTNTPDEWKEINRESAYQ